METILIMAAFPTLALPGLAWIPPRSFEEEVVFISIANLTPKGVSAALHLEMRSRPIMCFGPFLNERPPPHSQPSEKSHKPLQCLSLDYCWEVEHGHPDDCGHPPIFGSTV